MKHSNHRLIISLLAVTSLMPCFLGNFTASAKQPNLNPSSSLIASNTNIDYRANALNSIYFWEPCIPSGSSSGSYGSGTCGQTLTSTDVSSRLREAVEKFGGFAMDMQIEYGVPWETIFMHMYQEAQMGLAGSGSVAAAVEQCGYINIMGYVYGSRSLYGLSEEQMGDCKPIHGDNKALAAQFASYEDMIASFYTDYLRNGYYDAAFSYLDPNNYDVEKFLETETNVYSTAGWDGRVAGYGKYKDAWNAVKDVIHEIAQENGWPTSAELAKQRNIPIGGKHPVNGDIKAQIDAAPHSLSACNGLNGIVDNDNSSTDTSSSTDSGSSSNSEDTPSSSNSGCGGDITAANDYERLKEVAEKYGQLAMNLQVEYGTPWELVFAVMEKESNVGIGNNTIAHLAGCEFNWTGSTYQEKQLYSEKEPGCTTDRGWAGFTSIPNMIAGFMIDFMRGNNSRYEKAFSYLDPDNYNLMGSSINDDSFFRYFIQMYCPSYECDHESYWNAVNKFINMVDDKAKELGWPTSAQLAKQKKIPIGGKHPNFSTSIWDQLNLPAHSQNMSCDGLSSFSCGGRSITKPEDYPAYAQQTGHTCGPTSMAMLATVAAGKEVSESDVINIVGGDWEYVETRGDGMVALDKLVGDKYGFNVEQVNVNDGDKSSVINSIREYLKKGYMIHISGCGNAPFTERCHYVGIFDIDDDDNVFVADSSSRGNASYKLSDVINAGYHGNAFSAIGGGDNASIACDDSNNRNSNKCSRKINTSNDEERNIGTCSAKVLNSIDKIIALAKKNGYEYVYGGGHGDTSYFDSILHNNAKVEVDCTGFASLVMYAAFGAQTPFTSSSIASNTNYIEVAKTDVQPGDIFAYNVGCTTAHGGIVTEVNNGLVTKIAQTGRTGSGYSMLNAAVSAASDRALGYFGDAAGATSNLGCVNGKATDLKFYRYKGCR